MTSVIPAEILTQHTGVLGKTGSGKTTTGKLIVERVVADGYRVCVLDPIKSDWWGISTAPDGKKPGLPFVILGGPYGHMPISTNSAAAIGELVGAGELPLSVLDLASLEPGGVQKFFVHFAESLWRSARRGVLYLVLEEAHEFAPKERAGFGAENLSIHWAKKLATGARAKGIRLVVATQRTQALHNAVLGSCETMIVHRLTQPADQKPVLGWLKANVQDPKVRHEIESTMSSLKTGTGWLCSGEAQIFRRVAFPRISTYDNSATPTDDDEAKIVRPADVDVGELKEALADAVAEAEANDPEMLRKRIRDLEQQSARLAPPEDPAVLRELRERITLLEAEKAELWRNVRIRNDELNKRADFIHECRDSLVPLQNLIARLELSEGVYPKAGDPDIDALVARNHPSVPARASAPRPAPRPALVARSNGHAVSTDGTELGKGERVVLTAIAQYGAAGVDSGQLYVLTGYKARSITDYVGRLRAAGYVDAGWPARATPTGVEVLGSTFEPLPVGDRLREYWLARLTGGEERILRALVAVHPSGLSNHDIGQNCEYAARSVTDYVGRLKARRLVDRRGPHVFASELLFG